MKKTQTEVESLLQEWRVTSPLPPRFHESVWNRIERNQVFRVSLVDAVQAWVTMAFARPAFALTYVSVLLGIGTALGFAQATHKEAHWNRQLEAGYVQLIDPYQRSH